MKPRLIQRVVSMVAALAFLAGVSPAVQATAHQPAGAPEDKHYRSLPARRLQAQGTATVLIAVQDGAATQVSQWIRHHGGHLTHTLGDGRLLVARLPQPELTALEQMPAVVALALDRPLRLDPREMESVPETRSQAAPSQAHPGLSLEITAREIQADAFQADAGVDGSGIVVAVIDTGVDPGHPDLLRNPDRSAKIVDWQDFTGEGDVALDETRSEPIPGIATRSGTYRLGVFKEAQIPAGDMQSDLDRDGDSTGEFLVLATDAAVAGVYDTVYVDTNGNGDLSDEEPLRPYRVAQEWAHFGPGTAVPDQPGLIQGVNFVVTRLAEDGSLVNLGFDGAMHGTHVAGIVAANGAIKGVAPGAQVMALKALTSGGGGSWTSILSAMQYAAENGARVINMSLGGLLESNDGNDPQSLFINFLTERYKVLFSVAAGNSGPGLNSMSLPGVATEAITAGAYISPETFRVDYGLDVRTEGLWFFSSNGPREDGALKPNIIAPGTARSATPGWSGLYQVFQGTSMAAPQTAGAAALLWSAAAAEGKTVHPRQVRLALQQSARRLPGYGFAEQGHGLIQVAAAWEVLRGLAGGLPLPILARGGFDRDGASPYRHTLTVQNRGFLELPITLSYTPGAGNMQLYGPQQVVIPPRQTRDIRLGIGGATRPGYYDALVQASLLGLWSPAIEYLVTEVVPHRLRWDQSLRGLGGTVPAARYQRHFVRVPKGMAELVVTLQVPQNRDGTYRGRVRLMAYDPGGMPAGDTLYAGAPEGPAVQELRITKPREGVWELVAYASHGAAMFGVPDSTYGLDLKARGVSASPDRIQLPGGGFGTVTFTNRYGDAKLRAKGYGFTQPKVTTHTVADGSYEDILLTVEPGTAVLRTDIRAQDPDAVRATLYYQDPRCGWTSLGSGLSHEIPAPAPGEYALEVTSRRPASGQGKTRFELATVQVRPEGESVAVGDQLTLRREGSTWSVPVTVKAPAGSGPAYGAVVLTDEQGSVVQAVPVVVNRAR